MVEVRKAIQLDEAIERLSAHSQLGDIELVSLHEAEGRYLAEGVKADHPAPLFDRSMYDGFAVKSEDTTHASQAKPTRLEVIEHIPAGMQAKQSLQAGQAMRIMTGAQMPVGADAVVMLEHVQEETASDGAYLQLFGPLQKGENISFEGEDTQKGSQLIPAGERIGAGEKAVLATFGYAEVLVYRQPKVGIFATGSELLSVDQPLEPGKIRNSNAYMLEAAVKQVGANPVNKGILADDFELCYQAVHSALAEVDVLLTTGGASVGDFDFVQAILQKLGAKVLFNKIAVRPGSVTTAACYDFEGSQKWIFGLSGNPAACYIGFELFVRPVIKRLLGVSSWHLPKGKAITEVDIKPPQDFRKLMRAKVTWDDSSMKVQPVGLDKSGIVTAFVEANALLVVKEGSSGYAKGEEAEVILLEKPLDFLMPDRYMDQNLSGIQKENK